MSYPDLGTKMQWVLAGSLANDPVVVNDLAFTVIVGDYEVNPCRGNCPEQPRRNVGQQDEEFLTSVYTDRTRKGITVTVNAETNIVEGQILYILDATPGAVILTNVNPNGLDVWGRVLSFADPNNVVPPNQIVAPNTKRWLEEGDTSEIGCVEAQMVWCGCP